MDRSALNKATSADDTPTPGYLYTEIAQSTFADLNACQQLADYLIKKLEKDNPHVKLKCLKIIKHVCEQGKPEFKRAIQRKAEVVKACLQYRGTPDPLKGDAPNKAVREEADLAVKAVFSSNASLNAYGFSTGQGKKMQGFGSEPSEDISSRIGNLSSNSFSGGGSSFEGGGGRSFGSAGGMVGFGNPNFENAPPRKDDDSVFNKAMSSTMSAVSYLQSKVTGAPAPPVGGCGCGGSDGTYRPPPVGSSGNYGGGSGYTGPSPSGPSYSSGASQNYGIHGPGGAHRRWGHRNEAAGAGARETREAPAEAEAPPPPPAMVDLLDMEEPTPAPAATTGAASTSLLDEAPTAATGSEDLLGGGDSLIGMETPSVNVAPEASPTNLVAGIDMTQVPQGGVPSGCGGGVPGGVMNSMGSSMASGQAMAAGPMTGMPGPMAPAPMVGGSMGSSMGPMGQMGQMGQMGGSMASMGGMGGMAGMGCPGNMGGMGGMGGMGMNPMACPQMGCGPMGSNMGNMGMCGGCMGGMGGCGMPCNPMGGAMGMGNMGGMGMMSSPPAMQQPNQAYVPPSGPQAPYQNGSTPMQSMGMSATSTPSGGGSAFSFIGGNSASPSISPAPAPKPPGDMAFGFVAEEMKGAVS